MRKRNSSYVPEDSMYPFEGLDLNNPSTMLDSHHSPSIQNMDVDKGHLRKRRGFSVLAGAINGTPLAMFEFETLASVVHLILITTTKEYRYDTGTGAWVDITFKNAANVTTNRTGTEDDGIDYTIATGIAVSDGGVESISKWLIITNGVDKPRYWDGTLAQFYEYSVATLANHGANLKYTNFLTCKTISSLGSYIVMGNVTTSAGNEPTTIAWSDTSSFYNFGTSTTPPPGNSGAIPLTDASGPILKLEPLSERMMIYADDTIHAMFHIGGDGVFSFERLLSGTRLVSRRSIVNIRSFHLFLAQENVLLFDGSRALRAIGDRVAVYVREVLSPDLKKRAWAFLDIAKNQVYWAVPTSTTETLIFKMEYDEYDIANIRWTVYQFRNRRLTCMGSWKRATGLHWNDTSIAATTWASAIMNWEQGTLRGGFPQRLIGYGNNVGIAEETSGLDDTSFVIAWFQSPDLTVPQSYLSEVGRWIKLEAELRGSDVDIQYSVDRGHTWTTIKTKQTLQVDWDWYSFDLDVVAEQIRFQLISGYTSGFEARGLRAWICPAGER